MKNKKDNIEINSSNFIKIKHYISIPNENNKYYVTNNSNYAKTEFDLETRYINVNTIVEISYPRYIYLYGMKYNSSDIHHKYINAFQIKLSNNSNYILPSEEFNNVKSILDEK